MRPTFRLAIPLALLAALCLGCGGKDSSSTSGTAQNSDSATTSATSSATPTGDAGVDAGATAADTYSGADGACSALAPSQVSAVLGAEGTTDGVGGRCTVANGDKKVEVDVMPMRASGYADTADFVASSKAAKLTTREVPGVGDAAFFSLADSTLSFVCGDQFVEVKVTLSANSQDLNPQSDKSKELAAATAFAKTAASRCPL